jgi:sulfonate transport system substrate-binding protein
MLTRRQFSLFSGIAAGACLVMPKFARADKLDVVRFCWSGSVIVSGQVQHVLKNTDIAAKHGIKLEMTQFVSGPGISEALVSGAGDVGSLSDFSCVTMMAAGAPLTTISHESTFRSALLATPKSGIKSLAELRGKAIYGVFGVTAYQHAQQAVVSVGLVPGKDVTFVNLGLAELADAVRSQQIDAFFAWDPWIAVFEQAGLGVTLTSNTEPAMLLMASNKLVNEQPDVARRFLLAQAEAAYFASQNHALTNGWYRSINPGKSVPEEVIESASMFDPQWRAKSPADIKRALSPKAIEIMQGMAGWGYKEKLLLREVDVKAFINTSIAESVDAEMAQKSFDLSSVKVTG